MRIQLDRRVLIVVLCLAILLVVPLLALWQQWGLWRYSTNGAPNSAAISSDGSYLAVGVGTGPQGGRILFLDRAGSLLWAHDTDRLIGSVAISADGSHIAAAGYQLIGPSGGLGEQDHILSCPGWHDPLELHHKTLAQHWRL